MKNIILLAPPASGKGTQASLLKDNFNLVHISTGDLLRTYASRDDELGKKINEIMSSGTLVSDDVVIELLENKIISTIGNNGFIFDGFPRNINQANELDRLLISLNMKIDYVFLLNTDYEILKQRILGRRICNKCYSSYNINTEELMPKVENTCDKCGNQLTSRSDDNLDSFEIRYQEYLSSTYPIIEYYKNKGILIEIDSSRNKEDIFNDISSYMKRDV